MVKCKKCKSENIVKNGKFEVSNDICAKIADIILSKEMHGRTKKSRRKRQCVCCNMDKERHPLICWQKSMTHGLPLSIDG